MGHSDKKLSLFDKEGKTSSDMGEEAISKPRPMDVDPHNTGGCCGACGGQKEGENNENA